MLSSEYIKNYQLLYLKEKQKSLITVYEVFLPKKIKPEVDQASGSNYQFTKVQRRKEMC
jgi:hypothetical protein